ncbi:tetratricopeptide repeat protein [Rufibacter immobilis]|uniref:tetratricopeptide repeat protein n=1 Tax=Rufibacter immobilis TaxID=1348778 RepID=UPI0035E4B210
MPTKEIKELRNSGKLEEAYAMAKAELGASPEDIWAKRNMSWVLYSQLKNDHLGLSLFLSKLEELAALELPATEDMLFDNLSIVIAKAVRQITSLPEPNIHDLLTLFNKVKDFPLKKQTVWYSSLYGAFHKGFKDTEHFLPFADWWGLDNFREEDYQKETLPNGKEIMSLAEQAYTAYAKQLLPKHIIPGVVEFDREKVEAFMPKLDFIVENYPTYTYPAFYKAKLLLALGDEENMLAALLPFAKKKRNDFWVWDVLSEAFKGDEEKVLACYCRALLCHSPEEMLVNLRQRLAALLIKRELYSEAKTEIEKLIVSRNSNSWRIPVGVTNWQETEWYQQTTAQKSNTEFYKKYEQVADSLLFHDIPEESIIVSFVNSDKKMLNFITVDGKAGFFKYDRFVKRVEIGDTLTVRFKNGVRKDSCQVYTLSKANDYSLKEKYIKEFEGPVRIPDGKGFGFVDNIFLHPSMVTSKKLTSGMAVQGKAIKVYDSKKGQWGWKVLCLN